MSSLKFAVLCVLAAYLLVVAFNFITKLRDARLMQKLLCMLFPHKPDLLDRVSLGMLGALRAVGRRVRGAHRARHRVRAG